MKKKLVKTRKYKYFRSKSYIEYESNSSNRNKALPVEEYLNKIAPYLKGIINIGKSMFTS